LFCRATGERTVLLSSHLLGEVEQICDRAAYTVGFVVLAAFFFRRRDVT
jgi:ABC-type multidrug transport system ATPase subunit